MFVARDKARQEGQWMTWMRAEHRGIVSAHTHLYYSSVARSGASNITPPRASIMYFPSFLFCFVEGQTTNLWPARLTSIRFGMFSLPNLLFQISKTVSYRTFFVHSFMGASLCTSWNSARLSFFWRSFRWRHRLSFSLCALFTLTCSFPLPPNLMAKLKRTESTFAFHLHFPQEWVVTFHIHDYDLPAPTHLPARH